MRHEYEQMLSAILAPKELQERVLAAAKQTECIRILVRSAVMIIIPVL